MENTFEKYVDVNFDRIDANLEVANDNFEFLYDEMQKLNKELSVARTNCTFFAIGASALGIISCILINNLEKDIKDVEERVTRLESNDAIDALKLKCYDIRLERLYKKLGIEYKPEETETTDTK